MPSNVPTMTVLDPKNAALMAARILGLSDPELAEKLKIYNKEVSEKVLKTNLGE
jgi:phosphoribosylcarboxyaminoimidazole (NCAIR) mutase